MAADPETEEGANEIYDSNTMDTKIEGFCWRCIIRPVRLQRLHRTRIY
jgi:hypothetical protein